MYTIIKLMFAHNFFVFDQNSVRHVCKRIENIESTFFSLTDLRTLQ